MADIKKPSSPVSSMAQAPPESPTTTAKPLDFDDDEQEVPLSPVKSTKSENAPHPPPKDEAPPPKPPRPLNAREQAENTLKEAFPTIDITVVKAVLTASGGQVEPAFNALLGMSDPDAQAHQEPPAKPPRPVQQPTSTAQSQLEADEVYARQLHEHYSGSTGQGQQHSRYNEHLLGSRMGRPGAKPNPDDVPWRSFIDDDLPEIRDNIRKGFLETQSTVNKWIGTLKKKIDGDESESDFSSQPARPADGYDSQQGYGRRSGDMARRSADMSRYDADPQVIGDDFSKLDMRDGDNLPPRNSSRPLANPDLFKPATSTNRYTSPGIGRKVSFQDGPPEEIKDMYSSPDKPTSRPASTGKSSKWQPLSTVEPSPVADNDPFSLGDSDEEKDAKVITMKDDEDNRLKNATAEAMNEDMGAGASIETKK